MVDSFAHGCRGVLFIVLGLAYRLSVGELWLLKAISVCFFGSRSILGTNLESINYNLHAR